MKNIEKSFISIFLTIHIILKINKKTEFNYNEKIKNNKNLQHSSHPLQSPGSRLATQPKPFSQPGLD